MQSETRPVDRVIDLLRQQFGERLTTSAAIRAQHGRDESYHAPFPPDAVVFPRSTDEVVAIVKCCGARHVPVIPFGVGTSLEGHVAAVQGGVCIDLREMNRVLAVNAEDMDVTVEPGVTRKQLNEYLRDTGLFFPIDPGADATIGGMAATRASGTNAVRYGTMRENVLRLKVVLADGSVISTGSRARKSSAGYDLTRLFVGSEGTLGVLTEITLRLHGIPEAISAAACSFATLTDAVNTCITTIQSGVPVARIELMDALQMKGLNLYAKLDYPETPHLLFEFHGTARGVVEQAETVQAIAREFGGQGFRWATRPEDRTRLWQARHDALYAGLALRPGSRGWATDVCVPISRLAECIEETRKDLAQTGLIAPILGHVGDGNFHVVMLVDPDSAAELDQAKRFNDRLLARALAMDGTCTGEHGVGYGKLDFVEAEHGPAVEVMRALKRTLDPGNILNPGKVVRL
jgi:D-lactate dehydrogenase (cytochrome)